MADNMLKPSSGLIVSLLLSLFMVMITSFPSASLAISSCNDRCITLDDCSGQLICINGRCNDDPDVGTHTCSGHSPPSGGGVSPPFPPSGRVCQPTGSLQCGRRSYPQYSCSPPVTGSTRAILTNNDFSQGGDGGSAPACDESYHENSESVVALSTGWYAGGSRCGRMIQITSVKTGRSVRAKVVDECDSVNGCDPDHAGQPPCLNNIVDGSNAVWDALGLDTDIGEEAVYWSMA
ncbi:hypothetical protein MLD38_027776 [Melastoma candidum]|uniref:Uncharacterized protein n=1 Tax=Melastoma candidum TaxID=119954 RepID=A0ACB9P409_9MYRT|nr:hypothetical protein MLD38_027776 [Melastoma candidum]